MKLTGYKVTNKKALGIFVVAAIVVMFLIRYILLKNGTIDAMYTLGEEELYDALQSYEVYVSASDAEEESGYTGGGTILDGRKNSASEEEYTLTIAAALYVTGTPSQERDILVTLPDGTQREARIIAFNESAGFALLQCLCPEELEVYYSRDILYRLETDDPVYLLSYGELVSGSVTDMSAQLEWIEEDLIAAAVSETSPDIEAGAGLYGKSGNYLGLVAGIKDGGAVLAVPGDVIMAALDAAL